MKRAIAVVCLLTGCAGLGPRPDRSRFFTLTPLAPEAAGAAAAGRPDLSLRLGPIVFPGYLDRLSIVRRTKANEIAISATDRWAEPLRDAFPITLRQNLIVLLGTPRVVLYPSFRPERPELAVELAVLRFEGGVNGDAELTAHWNVVRVADGAILLRRTSDIVERANGRDTDAEVAALSRALGTLSREIATAVHDEEAGGRARAR